MRDKNYSEWHILKTEINNGGVSPFFHERQVWFVSLGVNVGFEQDGRGRGFLRPVIILKKFSDQIFWGIPTTKKIKKGKYYFNFQFSKDNFTTAILSQLRLIDSKRLKYRIGNVAEEDFVELKKRIINFLK